MKRRLLLPLMICVLVLAGCYRQAEEPIQQVNSSEIQPTSAPITVLNPAESSGGAVASPENGTGNTVGVQPLATSRFITPEPPPGQIEQPTLVFPTIAFIVSTIPAESTARSFVLPTPTLSFEESLDPSDECVYSVLPGDNLYRLAIAFGTTIDDFFNLNQLESDALQIGQLLLVPDCESSVTEESVEVEATEAEATEETTPQPVTQQGPLTIATADSTETETSAEPTLLLNEGPRIHVVSAGETLVSIALRYGLTPETIISANELANLDQLEVGQELRIPDEDDIAEEEVISEPRMHVVSAGETLASIALRYGLTPETIVSANELADSGQLNVGQTLQIPAEDGTVAE